MMTDGPNWLPMEKQLDLRKMLTSLTCTMISLVQLRQLGLVVVHTIQSCGEQSNHPKTKSESEFLK